ncbi:MAG: mechanosensitive ion channel family protein [Elusimicrobia bacterium]|nr:mechanosensitive ion channel family protein [Elusimicrobiota bacterium]
MGNISALFGPLIISFYSILFVSTALLYRAAPASRKRLGVTAFLAICSIAGILAANFLGAAAGGLVKLLELVSRLLAVIAAINVAGIFGFSLVMPKLRAGVSRFVEDLILAGAYLAAGLAVISASGTDLSGVLATSAVVTGVVAFSLQDTLGNIIGGMVLHLEDSFMPGDWIGVEKYEGVVREIRWRQTTIETLDGDLVVIPNIILMKSPVTVLGRASGNTRFRAVSFNVYYDRAPGEVISAIDQALREDPPACVAPAPAPYCAIKEFLPNCAAYEVRYYLTDLSVPGRTDSNVRAKIYYALSRAGIKLSIPARSVVVSEDAQQTAEKSTKSEMIRRLAALKGVDVLQTLTEEERVVLAGKLKPAPFAPGEMITKQGAAADWLYIIYEGKAEIRLYSGETVSYKAVKTLGPGDVLGEMGLFTGEPRSATAVASQEVRCYRLDREGFRAIIAGRPEIAESIAAMLAERRLELAEAKERMAGESAAHGLGTEQQDLLSKIKNFFRL